MSKMTAAEIVNMSVLHPKYVREQRDSKIKEMRREGASIQEIAEKFGLTRQRVWQIADDRVSP